MAAWGGTLAVSQLAELIIVAGVACAAAGGWLLLRNRFPGAFLALCLPWALIPLAVLVVASKFMPAFPPQPAEGCAAAERLPAEPPPFSLLPTSSPIPATQV
jgi:hypothetical protein